MVYLNLDKTFGQDLGEAIEFEAFTFPGGEFNIKLTSYISSPTDVMITQRVENGNDIIEILSQLKTSPDKLIRIQEKIWKELLVSKEKNCG